MDDSSHISNASTSGATSFEGVEPTQGSLEDGRRILENTAQIDCNYLKHLDLFPRIFCKPPISLLVLLMYS